MPDTGDRPVVLRTLALHAEAEEAIARALAATRAAHALAGSLAAPIRDEYEYGETVRSLRAALTALRSAQIDLEKALAGSQSAAG